MMVELWRVKKKDGVGDTNNGAEVDFARGVTG